MTNVGATPSPIVPPSVHVPPQGISTTQAVPSISQINARVSPPLPSSDRTIDTAGDETIDTPQPLNATCGTCDATYMIPPSEIGSRSDCPWCLATVVQGPPTPQQIASDKVFLPVLNRVVCNFCRFTVTIAPVEEGQDNFCSGCGTKVWDARPCKPRLAAIEINMVPCPDDGTVTVFSSLDGIEHCDVCNGCFTLRKETRTVTFTRCQDAVSGKDRALIALAKTLNSSECGRLVPPETVELALWPRVWRLGDDGCGCDLGHGHGHGAAGCGGGGGDPSIGCPVWVCCKGNCDPYSGWTKYPSIYMLKNCPPKASGIVPPCPPQECVTVNASTSDAAIAMAKKKIMAEGAPAAAIHGCSATETSPGSYKVCCTVDYWCDPGPPQRGNLPAGMGCCCPGSCGGGAGGPPPGGARAPGAGAPPPPPSQRKKPPKNCCCYEAEWGSCGGYVLTGKSQGRCETKPGG